MKTLKSVLIVAAVSAAFTLTAAEPLLSPRATGIKHPVVASGVKDPNLLAAYPKTGSRTTDAAPASTPTGIKDPSLLKAAKKCSMPPKAIDTPACKKMCETAGVR